MSNRSIKKRLYLFHSKTLIQTCRCDPVILILELENSHSVSSRHPVTVVPHTANSSLESGVAMSIISFSHSDSGNRSAKIFSIKQQSTTPSPLTIIWDSSPLRVPLSVFSVTLFPQCVHHFSEQRMNISPKNHTDFKTVTHKCTEGLHIYHCSHSDPSHNDLRLSDT